MSNEVKTMWELCQKYGYETKTGRINFKSPFYKIVCAMLNIKYASLSRKGKVILKANAISTYNSNQYQQADHLSEIDYTHF